MLTYATLTYAHVCSRILTHADVCHLTDPTVPEGYVRWTEPGGILALRVQKYLLYWYIRGQYLYFVSETPQRKKTNKKIIICFFSHLPAPGARSFRASTTRQRKGLQVLQQVKRRSCNRSGQVFEPVAKKWDLLQDLVF